MKLDDFLLINTFEKYKIGIERIRDEFIECNYERYLMRLTSEEWEHMQLTQKKEDKSPLYKANQIVENFMNQFKDLSVSDAVYIYPENYCSNYFMIQEIQKKSKKHRILNSLIPGDDTINHLVVFNANQKYEISLMNHLVYTSVLGDNYGGYKLFGVPLEYYFEFCSNEDYVYTLKRPNDLMHFHGNSTRKDTNPYKIYETRKNIEHIIKYGYFKDEFELYRSLKYNILPYLNRKYLLVKKWEKNSNIDYKLEISKLKSNLIEKGIIKSKWKNEESLFLLVKKIFSEAIFQYRPLWLKRQSLDIFIPELKVAIEYQGIQHYESVSFFGGDEGYNIRQVLDEKKRDLCKKNNVILIEWNYNIEISVKNLKNMLFKYGIKI